MSLHLLHSGDNSFNYRVSFSIISCLCVADSMYQSSTTSQDGLAEAIQLLSLSCRPSRAYQPTLGQSFVEEQPSHSVRLLFYLQFY